MHSKFVPVLWSISVVGCMVASTVTYEAPLVAVRRPADVQKRWGPYRLDKTDTSYTYTDSLIRIAFVPLHGKFAFELENLTGHTLQIIWDEMAYVGPYRTSSRVSPGETRVIDMERQHPPTVVPPNAKVIKIAIPNDLYHTRADGDYVEDFVDTLAASQAEGKEIQLLIPIRVEDVVNEYTFVFRLSHVALAKPKETGDRGLP